ncbi:Uncharacterised protein [Xylophilus ampelinus]|nr:Uncharacterised protein [Xylophilus ampelinus]
MRRPLDLEARYRPRPQRGVSLIAVMVIMLVASLLGLLAVQISTLGERGARNERDIQIALQSADAALADAEYDMRGPGTATRMSIFTAANRMDFLPGCGSAGDGHRKGLCLPSDTGKPVWLAVDFTDSSSSARSAAFGDFTQRTFEAALSGDGLGLMPARKPRYLIEVLPDADAGQFLDAQAAAPKPVYRVTAMGFGPRPDIQAVVQMIYRKE